MSRWLRYALHAAIILVPCSMLLPLHGAYYSDWYNHLWLISYNAQHLKAHGSIPITFNAHPDLGMPFPLFYGFLFFPALGAVSTMLGPDLTIRLFVVALLAGQYLLTRSTVKRLGAGSSFATVFAWIALWAIYPLTNLYNRNALPEFFAVGLLTCAVLSWFQVLLATASRERLISALRFGFFVCLAMGTHPITGLCSIPFLTVLVGASLAQTPKPKEVLSCLAPPILLTFTVLSAWLFIVTKFNADTVISAVGMVWVYFPTIDTFAARLLPIDSRIGTLPLSQISTPYLEATLNVPLFIFVSGLFYQLAKVVSREQKSRILIPLFLVAIEIFLFYLFASIDKNVTALLPSVFAVVQFGYRLVSYLDLTMLTAGLFALYLFRNRIDLPRWLVAACLALSFAGMAVKLSHVAPIRNSFGPLATTSELTTLPKTFNGFPDYELKELYQEHFQKIPPSQLVAFKPETGARFGQWPPVLVQMKKPGWLGTNVQVFPWTHLFVDGVELEASHLGVYLKAYPDLATSFYEKKHLLLAIELPAGTHTIDARIIPDPRWVWLRRLGYAVLLLWGVACLVPARRTASTVV